jgi:hypothetical protein
LAIRSQYKSGFYVKDRPNTGVHLGKIDPELTENPVYEKADYWTVKLGNPKHVKPMTQNHAKGGYHAPLSTAAGKHFHF